MASPMADIAKSYADLGSYLAQRWSDHGSKVGKKLDEGSYGECDECGKPIAEGRLEALPWATLCVDDAAARR